MKNQAAATARSACAENLSPEKTTGFWGREIKDERKTAVFLRDERQRAILNEIAQNHDELNHRPISYCKTPERPGEPSQEVYTPGGSKLVLRAVYGDVHIYVQDAHLTLTHELKNAAAIRQLLAEIVNIKLPIAGAVECKQTVKSQHACITLADWQQVKTWLKQHNGQRGRSQAQVMGINISKVTDYYLADGAAIDLAIKNLNLDQGTQEDIYQWLASIRCQTYPLEHTHLLDFRKLGIDAQTADNIIFATRAANSKLMVVEALATSWLKRYGAIDLQADVALIPGSHFPASKITCTLSAKDPLLGLISHCFEVEPMTERAPAHYEAIYLQLADQAMRQVAYYETEEEFEAYLADDGLPPREAKRCATSLLGSDTIFHTEKKLRAAALAEAAPQQSVRRRLFA